MQRRRATPAVSSEDDTAVDFQHAAREVLAFYDEFDALLRPRTTLLALAVQSAQPPPKSPGIPPGEENARVPPSPPAGILFKTACKASVPDLPNVLRLPELLERHLQVSARVLAAW